MKSYQLIQALEAGARIYRGDENHRLWIEPYRRPDNSMGFHLWGWGSAANPDGVLPLIMQAPEQFGIEGTN